jgi:hypothetical protein
MDKHIYLKERFLSPKQCQKYIDFFEKNFEEMNARIFCNRTGYYEGCAGALDEPFFQKFHMQLNQEFLNYCTIHPFLNIVRGVHRFGLDADFNIQKYQPGMCFGGEHMEHSTKPHAVGRILAWMVYLNTIEVDGGTHWPQQEFTSKPKAGDLYIWPGGWTHSHYGISAPNEIKYIMTGWGCISDKNPHQIQV